jgi:hypothetical protein
VLRFQSLTEWRHWRARGEGSLRLLSSSPFSSPPLGVFAADPESANAHPVVIALEHLSPTQVTSLLRPQRVLQSRDVAVVVIAPVVSAPELMQQGLTLRSGISSEPSATDPIPSAVLATSHCSGAGQLAWGLATAAKVPFIVVQHGVVTPFAPPLPQNAHLFAWSGCDAYFWASGRRDVSTTVVGSQILWEADQSRADTTCSNEPICFLGQLHGPELPRHTTMQTVTELARRGPLVYRPHPDESDLSSKLTHSMWSREGIPISTCAPNLGSLRGPIAGIFSTGILEAAASGIASYGYCVHPPRWISELWHRYQMAPLGESRPTEVAIEVNEPASVIADGVEALT